MSEEIKQYQDLILKLIDLDIQTNGRLDRVEYMKLKHYKKIYSLLKQIENLQHQLKQQKKVSALLREEINGVRDGYNQVKIELEQKEKIIKEARKRCIQEINASSIQYQRNHKQQELVYKVAHERIKKILDSALGSDNNE